MTEDADVYQALSYKWQRKGLWETSLIFFFFLSAALCGDATEKQKISFVTMKWAHKQRLLFSLLIATAPDGKEIVPVLFCALLLSLERLCEDSSSHYALWKQ